MKRIFSSGSHKRLAVATVVVIATLGFAVGSASAAQRPNWPGHRYCPLLTASSERKGCGPIINRHPTTTAPTTTSSTIAPTPVSICPRDGVIYTTGNNACPPLPINPVTSVPPTTPVPPTIPPGHVCPMAATAASGAQSVTGCPPIIRQPVGSIPVTTPSTVPNPPVTIKPPTLPICRGPILNGTSGALNSEAIECPMNTEYSTSGAAKSPAGSQTVEIGTACVITRSGVSTSSTGC